MGNLGHRRRITLAAIVALAGLGAAVALAGGGGTTYIPQLGISVPSEKAAQVNHAYPATQPPESTLPAPPPPATPVIGIPAHVAPADAAPIPVSPSLVRVTNDWMVSNGHTLVAVYAGQAGDNPADGRFVIIRQNLDKGVETEDIVNVPGAGAISIDSAPEGADVETTAQTASLHFTGANGRAGLLELAHDTVGSG